MSPTEKPPVTGPESTSSDASPVPEIVVKKELTLDEARHEYLLARKLRSNVLNDARSSKLFGRTIDTNNGLTALGGKEGVRVMSEKRTQYRALLDEQRLMQLNGIASDLTARRREGKITDQEFAMQMTYASINLMKQEQDAIDQEAMIGIERTRMEKMKNLWRTHGKTRLAISGAMVGLSLTGLGGLAALIGGRVAWGTAGTYAGVEALLERFNKTIGHKGLIDEIHKKSISRAEFSAMKKIRNKLDNDEGKLSLDERTELRKEYQEYYEKRETKKNKLIEALALPELQEELARLSVLQLEKGVELNNAGRSGVETGDIVSSLRQREAFVMSEQIKDKLESGTEYALTGELISNKLQAELTAQNKLIEAHTDKERLNKMKRKTVAAVAGVGMGWLVGSRLSAVAETPSTEVADVVDTTQTTSTTSDAGLASMIPDNSEAQPIISQDTMAADELFQEIDSPISEPGFTSPDNHMKLPEIDQAVTTTETPQAADTPLSDTIDTAIPPIDNAIPSTIDGATEGTVAEQAPMVDAADMVKDAAPAAVEQVDNASQLTVTIQEGGGMIKSIANSLEAAPYSLDHDKAMQIGNALYRKVIDTDNAMFNLVHAGDTFHIDIGTLTPDQLQSGTLDEIIKNMSYNQDTFVVPEGGMQPAVNLPQTTPEVGPNITAQVGNVEEAIHVFNEKMQYADHYTFTNKVAQFFAENGMTIDPDNGIIKQDFNGDGISDKTFEFGIDQQGGGILEVDMSISKAGDLHIEVTNAAGTGKEIHDITSAGIDTVSSTSEAIVQAPVEAATLDYEFSDLPKKVLERWEFTREHLTSWYQGDAGLQSALEEKLVMQTNKKDLVELFKAHTIEAKEAKEVAGKFMKVVKAVLKGKYEHITFTSETKLGYILDRLPWKK